MNSQHRNSLTSALTMGLLAAASASTLGCTPMPDANSAHGHAMTPAEREAKLAMLLSRENAPASLRKVTFLDGLAKGEIESTAEPRVECKTEDMGPACFVEAQLGKNPDGTNASISCMVSTRHDAFGLLVKNAVGEAELGETPSFEAKAAGEGIVAKFAANTVKEDANNLLVGTAKVASLYARGYVAACFDLQAGGRDTFARVVDHFFAGLKFADNPSGPAVVALGYNTRTGDRTGGFRIDTIHERAGETPGFLEVTSRFWLETDGKSWSVHDGAVVIERDGKGAIEKMTNLAWLDGKGPLLVSAKPSEDRKFRLKFEIGDKASGVESTPKAPLNTDLWAAPELARVASGAAPSYRFALLDVIDSDPSFHYLTITRSAPGVLLEGDEAVSASGKKPSKAANSSEKDELHVDGRGVVTKLVTSHLTSELMSSWGELPGVLAPKGSGKLASRAR